MVLVGVIGLVVAVTGVWVNLFVESELWRILGLIAAVTGTGSIGLAAARVGIKTLEFVLAPFTGDDLIPPAERDALLHRLNRFAGENRDLIDAVGKLIVPSRSPWSG
jgi:hypothetical protein